MSLRFQTSRFLIRDLQLFDAPGFIAMQTDPEVMRYTGSPAQTQAEALEDLQRVIACYAEPGNVFWVWAIQDKESSSFLGTCAIVQLASGYWDLGYRLLRAEWGRGIATEVLPGLIQYAFEEMKLLEVTATVDVENIASVKVLEKAGMQFVKQYYNEELQCTDRFYQLRNQL